MTHSPTPEELLALRTAKAALRDSEHPQYDIVSQIVFALGSAQLLQSPETAAQAARYRLAYASARRGRRWLRRQAEQRQAVTLMFAHRYREAAGRVVELETLAGDGSTRTADEDPIALSLTSAGCGSVRDVLPCVLDEDHGGPVHQDVNGYRWPTAEAVQQAAADLGPVGMAAVRSVVIRHLEDPHDSPLHHTYEKCRDLPPVGEAAEAAAEMLADRHPTKGAS